MKNKNFIITRTANGGLVKRYYENTKDNDGNPIRRYYYAKRLNAVERAGYHVSEFTKGIVKSKNKALKLGVLAVIATGAVLVGMHSCDRNKATEVPVVGEPPNIVIMGQTQNNGTTEQETTAPELVGLETPVAETYINDNNEIFIKLDSALEISRYNYLNTIVELRKYNETASEEEKFNFNTNMFNPSTFVGVQIRESSLMVYQHLNSEYQGGFKIGPEAMEEANEVAIKLTGKPILESQNDLYDPIKSNKACMYIFIKNYEYVYDCINNNNLNYEVDAKMVIDEYLFGCTNIMNELKNGSYYQKEYSKDVLEYAKILQPYLIELFERGLIDEEHDEYRTQIYNLLNKVTQDLDIYK